MYKQTQTIDEPKMEIHSRKYHPRVYLSLKKPLISRTLQNNENFDFII